MEKDNYAIVVESLRKSYKGKEVLKNVNLSILQGSIYALLGSNGAGKTTMIRILTTQIKADSGRVAVEGYDTRTNAGKIHEVISLTGQFSAVDEKLTGKENLMIMGRLRQLQNPEEKAEELLNYFELSKSTDCAVSSYSGGMKRKLDIAMSLVGDPKIIFLDEPTTALDPQSRRGMWKIIRELNRSGVTIFLTTQYLEEAEQLADRVGVLDKGKIIAEGTPTELKEYIPRESVQFTFESEELLKKAKLLMQEYKILSDTREKKITIFTDNKVDLMEKIFHRFHENNIKVLDFSTVTPSLEDAFLTIIADKEDAHENSIKKI